MKTILHYFFHFEIDKNNHKRQYTNIFCKYIVFVCPYLRLYFKNLINCIIMHKNNFVAFWMLWIFMFVIWTMSIMYTYNRIFCVFNHQWYWINNYFNGVSWLFVRKINNKGNKNIKLSISGVKVTLNWLFLDYLL